MIEAKDDDAADFDATETRLKLLRETPEWKSTVAAIGAKAKQTARSVWAVAVPILKVAGEAALPIVEKELADLATSMLAAELDKLAGGKS